MRLTGPRLTTLLVVGLVVVVAGGTSLALWIGRTQIDSSVSVSLQTSSSAQVEPTSSRAPSSAAPTSAPVIEADPNRPTGTTSRPSAIPAPPAADPATAPPLTQSSTVAPDTTSVESVQGQPGTRSSLPATTGKPSTQSGFLLGPSTNQTVQIGPKAVGHPELRAVRQAIQRYFDAINQKDYEAWTHAVSEKAAAGQDEGSWQAAYNSTTDSSIRIEEIAPDGGQVAVRFTSEQELALAPPDLRSTCINWSLSYRLAQRDGRIVVDATVGDSVVKVSCA